MKRISIVTETGTVFTGAGEVQATEFVMTMTEDARDMVNKACHLDDSVRITQLSMAIKNLCDAVGVLAEINQQQNEILTKMLLGQPFAK